jgi:hypothetical protein
MKFTAWGGEIVLIFDKYYSGRFRAHNVMRDIIKRRGLLII